ncbi:SDR family NAD(P)-dependent oxidoreductase [Streptomyces sp. NPDC048002]|uniref:SDR family NAD(P)-dependent oxidoreductase n=1 Tax=Streptomyces sp. NPDC048002 TaxID=3154344 RepID=UPI0033D470DC
MNEIRFDGKVAIVTGAGGNPGLGRSYALLLARRGAKVVVNDLGVGPAGRGQRGSGAAGVVREIEEAGGEAIASEASVAERDGADAIVKAAVDRWGRVDVLINNAGIAPFADFDEITDTDIERVVGVHVLGQIWMCRAVWPYMKRQRYGRIINVSSNVPLAGVPKLAVYAAAKMGAIGLTRALAFEGTPHGVKVNALCPVADTQTWQTLMEPGVSARAQSEGATPERVAPVAALLAHEDVPFTGKTILAKAGGVSEVLLSVTKGFHGADVTPESVLGGLSAATDRSGAQVFPDPAFFEYPEGMRPLPYLP